MSKIEELQQRLNRLDLEKAAVSHKLTQIKRKGDAKKKILYGAAALKLAMNDPELQERLTQYLDMTVKSAADRLLLGLPELVDTEPSEPDTSADAESADTVLS